MLAGLLPGRAIVATTAFVRVFDYGHIVGDVIRHIGELSKGRRWKKEQAGDRERRAQYHHSPLIRNVMCRRPRRRRAVHHARVGQSR